MLREQNRMDSKVMIRGIITLIVVLVKLIFNFELSNYIQDSLAEIILIAYGIYTVVNSPRVKGEL